MFSHSSPMVTRCSTSCPASVRRRASSSGTTLISIYSLNQERGALNGIYFLPNPLELLQEPQVVTVEQSNVVDAVAQHGDPFGAHAEGEAAVLVGVYAAVDEHLRVDHARAHDLQPACVLACPAAFAAAHDTVDGEVYPRLHVG